MAVDMELVGAIHRVELEIAETKSKIKTVREDREDQLAAVPEYQGLQILEEKVKVARAALKEAISGDPMLERTVSELDELKFRLKDLTEILDHHLVVYFQVTGRETVLDSSQVNRQIELHAKLGVEAPPDTAKLPFEDLEAAGASVQVTQTLGGKKTIIKEGKK